MFLQQEPRRRNKIMCKNCRHDKQRCEPRSYDHSQGERCERCTKLDYDCSPPEKKERAKRKPQVIEVPTAPVAQAAVFNGMAQRFNSDDRIFPSTSRAIPSGQTDIEAAKRRPVVSWFAEMDSTGGVAVVVGDSDTPISEDFTQVGKNGELEARRLVAKLGTLLVIRILFEQDLLFLSQLQDWIGTSDYIDTCRAAFKDFISRVLEESRKLGERARSIVLEKKQLGPYNEAFLEDVGNLLDKLHDDDFKCPPLPKCAERHGDTLGDFFHDTRHRLQKNRKTKSVFSTAALMTKATHNCTLDPSDLRRESDATQVTNFQQASSDIEKALSGMQLQDLKHDEIFFGPLHQHSRHRTACIYLPCSLAARNSTETILEQLWTESPAKQMWEVDCFLRTPVHYAAYYACVSNLEAIFKRNDKSVADLGPDKFGMTPLAIAACKDDLKSFRLLLRYGASLDAQVNGKSILTLAARNNSVEVAKHILARNRLPPSLTPELVEATKRGHLEICQLLMQKYNSMPKDDYSWQINSARALAERTGRLDLANALLPQQPMPNVNQTMLYLEDLHHDHSMLDEVCLDSQQPSLLESQTSLVNGLWDFHVPPSSLSYGYPSTLPFESLPFDSGGIDWFDNQNQNPSGYVDD